MDTSGEVVLLHEIASWICPATIRICGLVTYVDVERMMCQLSDPTTTTVATTSTNSKNTETTTSSTVSSSSSRAIYTHDEANLTTLSSSHDTHTLLVRCDRVGLSGTDLYTLKTFIGVLLDEKGIVNSNTVVRENHSTTQGLAPLDSPQNKDSRCASGNINRILEAVAVASSDGLDYSLYCRVVIKRRQFLQQQSDSKSDSYSIPNR